MGRPLTGSSREKNGRIQLRLAGHSWSLPGRAAEWSQARIDRELAAEVARYKSDPRWRPPQDVAVHHSGQRTVAEACNDFAAKVLAMANDKNRHELLWRLGHITGYEPLANTPVAELKREHIEDYQLVKIREREYLADLREQRAAGEELNDDELELIRLPQRKGLSNRTINRTLDTFARVLAREREADPFGIPLNVIRDSEDIKLKATDPPRVRLNARQSLSLIEAGAILDSRRRDHIPRSLMLRILITAGPRISELTELRRRDVQLDAAQLIIPKGKTAAAARSVDLTETTLRQLKGWMKQSQFTALDDPLFPTSSGKFRDSARFRDRILLAALDIADTMSGDPIPRPVSPHSLRRTYASLATQLRPVTYVMTQMGHKTSAMTMTYAKYVETDRESLLKLLDWPRDPLQAGA